MQAEGCLNTEENSSLECLDDSSSGIIGRDQVRAHVLVKVCLGKLLSFLFQSKRYTSASKEERQEMAVG